MKTQYFEVPIVQQDLRHEEAIVQISDALQHLNTVFTEVFSQIEARIGNNQRKLDCIVARTNVTRAKVEKLTGSNKATKVFSSAKYPATDVHKDYESIYSSSAPCEIVRSNTKLYSSHLPAEGKVLQEKLQFYHVKTSNKLLRRNIEIAPEEGLGSLPEDIDSVSSLLLFNTSENPYKRYVMLDPLGAITKTRQPLNEAEEQQMEAAPLSISHQEKLERQAGENYFYSPGLGEVPQIDLPLDLPYLPGVADDLCYTMDFEPMIAPSVASTPGPAIPDLPQLVIESPTITPVDIPPPPVITAQPIIAVPPPPPPPPPPPVSLPPPPPPPAPVFTPSPVVNPNVSLGGATGGEDPRTNLMAAIRKAGGSGKALLKSVEEKTETKKRNDDRTSGEGTGDLMADLHAKLAMRRKGISGAMKNTEASAMDRIKDMIPPPAARDHSTSSMDENDDWD